MEVSNLDIGVFSGHHKRKQETLEKERQEALARSMPVTPPRYSGMGPRPGFMPQRSPIYSSPRQPALHPVSLRASPGTRMRHEPYPVARPVRRGSLNTDQVAKSPGKSKLDGQVIKIEPEDGDQSNQSAPGAPESSQPASPSVNPSTPSSLKPESDNNDDAESSSSTIPNEGTDYNKVSDTGPPGGLSLDSDLSNLISATSTSTTDSAQDTSTGLDPDVSVKLEAVGDSDMDLEITGVELGSTAAAEQQMLSQDWAMGGMPSGATGGPGDMAAGQQGYSK